MSTHYSCAICGIPVTDGMLVDYHKKDNISMRGTAYVHDSCMPRFQDYMTGMGMIPDDTLTYHTNIR